MAHDSPAGCPTRGWSLLYGARHAYFLEHRPEASAAVLRFLAGRSRPR
ncbi:hypothetical protein [Pseudonocardia aurantiaca]|uniref:Uncharacterized protein n=1 Tax=Pseudonocardia aurantiaca TaxID=75290 RepID=A0ABW4FWK3_9PSEU